MTRTRIDTVMDTVRRQIASRTWVPGTRLPSVRAQARTLGCSVSTVVEAYERLAADNVITARPGAGFYVCGPAAPLALAELGPPVDREIDPLWVSRQSLEAGDGLLKPGCGWLPADWMYEDGMRRALRSVARADAAVLADYATPQGLPAMRQWLARRLGGLDIEAPPEQILLTESGTQAVDLIGRFLLEPGDTVLVDDPCYFNFHALLRAHRVQVVGVPYTPRGPDVAAFEAALQAHRPRLYLTNAGLHNPTGAALSSVTAHRLLQLAERAGLVIVEDDIFADFETQPAPRLAAFDGLARVISIGSFSKTVSASLRCGYIAARPDWIAGLTDLKIATSFGGGHLATAVLHSALTGSGYRRHLDSVRLRLAQAMAQTITRLRPLGIEPWTVPTAGLFLWCRLPGGHDAADVARACLRDGVVLAPGNAFSLTQGASAFLRFNVAQSADERLFESLRRALAR
ncbi:aminotransferase-like domain-containing protein [Hydrogenophaga electricum]|uniref:GntR family transcriptional regulator n=1 Tax=Hydrogenophaga electricum TaxID=1230953 RepID=A0ABQ6C0K5_9BURK|nr:PLP-dependent aminotransferase family protein [Hydrogenophaga electricum]GLS13294.1 GntR family transcriptional regulator [Hydrogenophaga electricum]